MNDGVVTVRLNYNIKGRKWFQVANKALNIVNEMDGIDMSDYGVFVMPNSVDFEGAFGYGYMPGIFTFFKSFVASVPVIQVHELGESSFVYHTHLLPSSILYVPLLPCKVIILVSIILEKMVCTKKIGKMKLQIQHVQWQAKQKNFMM